MINHELLPLAISVGERMSNEYIAKGDYYPAEAWGCEGQIYPSIMGILLLNLYLVERNELFLNGVKAIIKTNVQKQRESGGWALSLGASGNGISFKVDSHLKEITASIEDLPPTATAIRLIVEYRLVTGDTTFDESLNKGYDYLMKFWNEREGCFNEMLVGEALKLRANPKNYLIYTYQCLSSISQIKPEAIVYVEPLYKSLKKVFEKMHKDTYPLLYGMYASLIISIEKDSEYVKNVIKQRISEEIALYSKFIINEMPGAFGHVDGLRGICLDEGHLRNSVGAALSMKFYDYYTNENFFTSTSLYQDLTNWITSMFEVDKFFEFVDIKTEKKYGVGTPGQFVPLMWILGKV